MRYLRNSLAHSELALLFGGEQLWDITGDEASILESSIFREIHEEVRL